MRDGAGEDAQSDHRIFHSTLKMNLYLPTIWLGSVLYLSLQDYHPPSSLPVNNENGTFIEFCCFSFVKLLSASDPTFHLTDEEISASWNLSH